MTILAKLEDKIDRRAAIIGVIGLGYVGLPVAAAFAQAGFAVIGVDLKTERVAQINAGQNPIEGNEPGLAELLAQVTASGRLRATTDYAQLAAADVILIDVETPVDEDRRPRYKALKAACASLRQVMKSGALIIIESTIAPGTTDKVARPILENGGLSLNKDFFLGVCPERVMPGKLLANLRQMSRVCGGSAPETAQAMARLYRYIVEADLDMTDPLTAELVKTTENAYRDVQIAFANEVALICEAVGGDVWQVRELVNKAPYRQMHLPGAGVGGHCIPKDPWLLIHGARGKVETRLIPAARAINEGMPGHMAALLTEALQAAGKSLAGSKIGVLGYAYLENSDDARHSPSAALIHYLREAGATTVVHDPWVAPYQTDLVETIQGCDAVVLMVAHDAYRSLNLNALRAALRAPIFVDGRGLFNQSEMEQLGFYYRAIGSFSK